MNLTDEQKKELESIWKEYEENSLDALSPEELLKQIQDKFGNL